MTINIIIIKFKKIIKINIIMKMMNRKLNIKNNEKFNLL